MHNRFIDCNKQNTCLKCGNHSKLPMYHSYICTSLISKPIKPSLLFPCRESLGMRVYLHIMTHLFLSYHSKNEGKFYYKEVYSQLCCTWLCMKLENWNVSQSSQSQVYVLHNHHDVYPTACM